MNKYNIGQNVYYKWMSVRQPNEEQLFTIRDGKIIQITLVDKSLILYKIQDNKIDARTVFKNEKQLDESNN